MRASYLLTLILACKGSDVGYTQPLAPGYVRLTMATTVYYACADWEFSDTEVYLYCERKDDAGDTQILSVDLLQEGGEMDGLLNFSQTDIGGSVNIAGGEAAGCIGACGAEADPSEIAATCDVTIDGETLGIISCGNTSNEEGTDESGPTGDNGSAVQTDGGFIVDWGTAVQLMPPVLEDIIESFD